MNTQGEDPRTLGRYEVVRRLAQGAMGVVYVGRDPQLHRPVALKTLQVSSIIDRETAERLQERFLEEPRITARLRHPNVVPVYDAGVDPATGIAWLALELVEGFDLSKLMTTGLTTGRVLDIADDVASGLDHAHQRGIVHRDVKPANILIDRDGRARLTDFGIAHELEAGRTQPGEFLGSPAYMAPEQIGGGEISPRTDVHALAVVLYEALTGKRPFETTKSTTTAQAVLSMMPTPPSRVAAHLPRSLDEVFRRALAKRPENRHETARQLAQDVRKALGSLKPPIDPDAQTTLAVTGRPVLTWVARLPTWIRISMSRLRSAPGTVASWDRRGQAALGAAAVLVVFTLIVWPRPDSSRPLEADHDLPFPRTQAPRAMVLLDPERVDDEEQDFVPHDGSATQEEATPEEATPEELEGVPDESRGASAAPSPKESVSKASPTAGLPPAPSSNDIKPPPRKPAHPIPVQRASATPTTKLYIDLYTTGDGVLTVLANEEELLTASTEELQRMPARFRGFAKKRYRAEATVPSAGEPLRIRFQPRKSIEVLETTETWDLPPGGEALLAVEVGRRGRELEVELLERVEAKGS